MISRRCSKCEAPMMLTQTDPAHLSMRTFKCVNCGHVRKEAVAVDLVKPAEALGCLFGGCMTPD
jgi:exosome complex RNA-binding protein Csl4